MEQEKFIDIPKSVLAELKKQLNLHLYKKNKPNGFEEAIRYVALEKATLTQLSKLVSFTKNSSSSNKEDDEKKEVLHKMIVFAEQWVSQYKRRNALSNKIRIDTSHPTGASTKNQSGREIDRFQPSLASTKPAEVNEFVNTSEHQRILEIINRIK